MKIWLITDTHFGHEAMHEYCGRPQDYEELIFRNLQHSVKRENVLIHLGDVCIGHDADWHDRFNNEIQGKHWLIKGNHDHKSNSFYLSHGWDMVCDQFRDKFFGKIIMFSHKPVVWDGDYDVNIHGHFHNSDHRRLEPELVAIKNGYQKLLAIEYTNYQPVTLEKFLLSPKVGE